MKKNFNYKIIINLLDLISNLFNIYILYITFLKIKKNLYNYFFSKV